MVVISGRVAVTWRELRAVRFGVEFFLAGAHGRAAEAYHGARPERHLAARALHPQLIRSCENVVADRLSRLAAPRDYVVSADLFEWAQRRWGSCTV